MKCPGSAGGGPRPFGNLQVLDGGKRRADNRRDASNAPGDLVASGERDHEDGHGVGQRRAMRRQVATALALPSRTIPASSTVSDVAAQGTRSPSWIPKNPTVALRSRPAALAAMYRAAPITTARWRPRARTGVSANPVTAWAKNSG